MPRYPQIEKLVDAARRKIRTRGMSRRTERAYLRWIRGFLRHHGSPHPDTLSRAHAEAYLEHLANGPELAPSTRNQAASALAFLYREVLGSDAMAQVPRSRGAQRLPPVLSHAEALKVLGELRGKYHLIGSLLYGTGMRVSECLGLRLKDVDFELDQIAVREGKGGQSRMVPLPHRLRAALRRQAKNVARLHRRERREGAGWAALPAAFHRRDPQAGYTLKWQFLFPATRRTRDEATGRWGRWHLDPSAVQREVKEAVLAAGILKRATCHTFRHSFATQLLRDGVDIRTVQKLMGHKDVRTTMRYLHTVDQVGLGVRSPLDRPRPEEKASPADDWD